MLFMAFVFALFGVDFWERIGLQDEPVFFFLSLIICPVAFLVGSMSTIVYSLKQGNQQQPDKPRIN
jgi:uncharacterized membrane protein